MEARHNYRNDDHAVSECSLERCQETAERMRAVAAQVIELRGQCGCGRVIGPRCFDGQTVRSCPKYTP